MLDIMTVINTDTERCTVRLLSVKNLNRYTSTVKEPFFNEFNSEDVTNVRYKAIENKLISLMVSYKKGDIRYGDGVRSVVERDGKFIGGITVTPYDASLYDIGYWILPEHQGNGYAFEVLGNITYKLFMRIHELNTVRLEIREDNIKSIGLAEKVGYKHVEDNIYNGKIFRVYKFNREDIEMIGGEYSEQSV